MSCAAIITISTVFAIIVRVCDSPNYVGLENIYSGVNITPEYYKTDELPNPRPTQPNPIKILRSRLKVAFGPLFPAANIFSWVGIDCI